MRPAGHASCPSRFSHTPPPPYRLGNRARIRLEPCARSFDSGRTSPHIAPGRTSAGTSLSERLILTKRPGQQLRHSSHPPLPYPGAQPPPVCASRSRYAGLSRVRLPWRTRSAGQRSTGPLPLSASPIAQGRAGAAKHRARIVPYNPFAFPPSLEVRCARAAIAQGCARAAFAIIRGP